MDIAHSITAQAQQAAGSLSRRSFLRGAGIGAGVLVAGLSSGLSVVSAQIEDVVEANLARFDELDFEAYSKQNWELFAEIHAPDVVVVNPDGHITNGIETHIAEASWLFSWAPDHAIIEHPVRFGAGDWTAVTGVSTGTFTQDMVMMDGSVVPPTGLAFQFSFATLARWVDGRIAEEQLYGDFNQIFTQVLGQGAAATPEATPAS